MLHALLDLILPPRCFGCGNPTSQHHSLCGPCWANCRFLIAPWCAVCGRPFPYAPQGHESQATCLSCHQQPPLYSQARSALAYDEGSRRFVIKFKHGDGTYLAPALSTAMMRVGREILANTDVLIPVPLHWRRLFWRQYNQATLLSLGLTRQTGIPTRTDILRRRRATPPQGHQNLKERYTNVRGAFVMPSEKAAVIKGKRLTVVDDVLTTGATITECTRTLLNAGAKEVRILTLARVIMPS